MEIRKATTEELYLAREIAEQTWPVAYSHILQAGQLRYMLDMFYSDDSLKAQALQQHHQFLLAVDSGNGCVGFASYSSIHKEEKKLQFKLHKLYVLPNLQKSGTGKQLLQAVMANALEQGATHLCLNVNRYNTAIDFYKKMGFEVIREEDIDIGNGYYMIDYVMERKL